MFVAILTMKIRLGDKNRDRQNCSDHWSGCSGDRDLLVEGAVYA